MKKIFAYILCAAGMTLAAASCEKFLDTESPSTFDAATVYSNYSLTESAIFSITQSFGETNNYRGRYLCWIGLNSDIEWYNTFKPTDEKYQIAAYSQLPNNGQLNLGNGPFAKLYEAIERANLVIEGIREYGKPEENEDMAYLLGETLTLRAMIYYDLTRAWGDVPARFESTTSETIYKPKASRDVIYKQLLADLEEAIPYLPYPGRTAATSRTDRINKLFAEGLYARIALMASGYAMRPDDGMEGTGDLGTNRLSNDPELQKDVLYPKALAYLKDAIDSRSASLEDFESMWKKQSNMDNLAAGPDYETLYVIPFSDGRGRWNFTFAVRSEGSSYAGGPTVTRGGDAGPVPTMWFKYDKNDIRRDITCVNWRWNSDDEQELPGINRWYFGKYRWEWHTKVQYTGGNDDGIKPVVMRYSDILLMAAEIENELNGPANAKKYLKDVRARACGEDAATAYVAGLNSKDAFFDAVVKERALEFCGEFLRKADLIRWNRLKSSLDYAKTEMFALRNLEKLYVTFTGDVAYSISDDGKSMDVIFPTIGEEIPAGYQVTTGYMTKYDDAKASGFYPNRINGIYYNNPDEYMYWPIFYDTITNSQGVIKNDYHYDNPQ